MHDASRRETAHAGIHCPRRDSKDDYRPCCLHSRRCARITSADPMTNKRSVLVVLAAVYVFAIIGCEPPSYSVARSAEVVSVPDSSKVLTILRSTPGIDSARYEGVDSSRAPKPTIYTYYYYGLSGPLGVIQFRVTSSRVQFDQYYVRVGEQPPQSRIDTLVPIMRAIEARSYPTNAGCRSRMRMQPRCTKPT